MLKRLYYDTLVLIAGNRLAKAIFIILFLLVLGSILLLFGYQGNLY